MSHEDRYDVLKTLGVGSLGRVELVLDRQSGERRALKRLQALDAETVERLPTEFAALARLRHPGLVQVHDLGPDFLTMEFLDGEPLDRAIAPGDVASALKASLEILDGLEFLHANGYAHCDLKPANVLMVDGGARIIDLGFVAHLGEKPGSRVRGTPGYLAPEVKAGGAYTRESDLYALGATLYRVLAGRAASPGRDAAEIVEAQDRGIVSLSPLRAMNVPPALDAPLLGLLSLDPRHRVPAARDLRELASSRVARGRSGPDVLRTAGRLLGRDAILDELRDLMDAGGAAVISGRRGAGKSRLALELTVEAELAGRPVVRIEPGSQATDLPPRALVVLEDLDEWPSEATLELRDDVFVVATQRVAPKDGDAIYRLLFRLANPPAPRLIALTSFAPEESRRLAEDRLGGRLAESIHQHLASFSGGWPGTLLLELDRLLREARIVREGDVWKETDTIAPVAETGDEGAALVEGLSEEARLAGAILAGLPLETDLANASGVDAREIERGLEDLSWSGHLVRDDGTWRLTPHSLARTLRADRQLDSDVRGRLASQLRGVDSASALLALGVHETVLDLPDALQHLSAAFEAGLKEDVRISDEATELILPIASAKVLSQIGRVWRERGDVIRADQVWSALRSKEPGRADLALEHAEMLANVAQFDRALPILASVGLEAGPILGLHGWCLFRLGHRDQGLAQMRKALELLGPEDHRNRAVFHSRLGITLFLGGKPEEGIKHLDASVQYLGLIEDPALEARLRGNLGLRYRLEGKLLLAQRENQLALELVQAAGRPEHMPTAIANLISTSLDLCDWVSWERYQTMLENISRQSGNAVAFGRCFEGRGTLGVARGRTRDAARALRRVRPWFTKGKNEEYYLYNWILRCVVAAWNGEFDRAIRNLRSAYNRAEAKGITAIQGFAARHLSELLLICGRLRSAKQFAHLGLQARGSDVSVAVPCLLVLALAALREGDEKALAEINADYLTNDAPSAALCKQEIAAFRTFLRGDIRSAKQAIEDSLNALKALDLAPREALLAWEFGLALQMRGDSDANAYLHRALEITHRGNMTGWSGRIAEMLAFSNPTASNGPEALIEARLLPKVIALMNSVVEFPALLHESLELAATSIGASRGLILLTGQTELELTAVAQYGGVDDGARASALEVSRTIVRRVTESGVPFIAGDVGSDPRLGSTQSLLDLAVRSLICVPLETKSQVIGTIYLESRATGTQFTTADLDLVESFAGLISVAIESGRLYDELKRSRERIVGQNLSLRRDVSRRFSRANIIGQSPEIVEVVSQAERMAVTRSNVLITGATGTGKELIAKLIHYSSPRADQPFIPMNCGAFPENLIESELFGILDRAATGVRARPGIFEQANGGTLFLDEIGELPLPMQVKLLRVLQEREFAPVGAGGKSRSADFRLISATNQDLQDMMDRGVFRSDLFHRIDTLRIHIPPLRDRKIDILLLANYFLEKFCADDGRPLPEISSQLKSVLLQSSWPGNVRGLQNYVERLAVMCQGPVLEPIFPPPDLEKRPAPNHPRSAAQPTVPTTSIDPATHRVAVEDFERARIQRALEETGGNQRRAADLLGLGESTLRYQLKKLDLKPEKRGKRRARPKK